MTVDFYMPVAFYHTSGHSEDQYGRHKGQEPDSVLTQSSHGLHAIYLEEIQATPSLWDLLG